MLQFGSEYSPEFVYNLIINIALVIGETVGIRLMISLSYFNKFMISLIPIIGLLGAMPFLVEYTDNIEVSWWMSIMFLFLSGIFLGTLNSSILGFCGMLNGRFIGYILLGISTSSMIVSFIRLICLITFDNSESSYFKGTLLYFGLNLILLIAMTLSIPVRCNLFINKDLGISKI